MKLNPDENDHVIDGFFQKRLNRFLAEVEIRGDSVLAHVPNPGRMLELLIPSKKVYLKQKAGPCRKTDYDLIAVEHNQLVISIDSNLPNRFILKLLRNHQLQMFSEYEKVIPEPRIYDGRFDFKLIGKSGNQLVEVKSCTLVISGRALFPDAPTKRGARHVRHLVRAVKEKHANRAAIVFVIQRPDASIFSPNTVTDPDFTQALIFANKEGVDIIPLTTKLVNWQLELVSRIPFELDYCPEN